MVVEVELIAVILTAQGGENQIQSYISAYRSEQHLGEVSVGEAKASDQEAKVRLA
ncbi:hypothetical protein D3C86_2245210 [compost metagenome]